jgi:hypothetical protein
MRLPKLPFLALTLALLHGSSANAEGVRVLHSDTSALEIELTPGETGWEPIPGPDGRTFRRPWTRGGIHQARPGEPDLPSIVRLVGLPPEGSARVRLLSVETVSERVADIAPAPEPVLDADERGVARERRTTLTAATGDAVPAQWAELGEPVSLRGRNFARLVLHPFRYSASRGELTRVRRLVVRVEFAGDTTARSAPARNDSWEGSLDEVVLNADVARGWAAARPVRRGGGDSFDSAQTWLRVPMTRSGVYLLDYFTFANAGIDPAGIDPRTVRVFSGTNLPLREPYDVPPPPFMTENAPLYLDDDPVPDGVFDIDDRFLFYALSAHGWANEYDPSRPRTEFVENQHTDVTYYWIAWGNGFAGPAKRMNTNTRTVTPTGPLPVGAMPHRVHFEENNVEDFRYKDEDGWQWESLQGRGADRLYTIDLEGVAPSGDGLIHARLLSHGPTTESTQRDVELKVGAAIVADSVWSHSGNRAVVDMQGCFQSLLTPGTNAIRVNAKKVLPNSADRIYTTWFDVEYNRALVAKGGSWLKFWSAPGPPPGVDSLCTMYDRYGQTSFLVQGLRTSRPGQEIFLFDVSNQHDVVRLTGFFTLPVSGTTNLWNVSFSDPGQPGTRWYVATTMEGVLPLAAPEVVQLAGLRSPTNGAEYVVIYHPRFQEGADRLAAIRRDLPGASLSTLAVNVDDIYNEFSWGQVDPTAIRDFLAYTLSGNWMGGGPVYVALVGDAAYDTKRFLPGSPENLIGTYSGRYRTEPFVQYTVGDNLNFHPTDDFFGYVETADYAPGAQLGLDIAIGRYAVKQPEDFDLLLDKLDEYTRYGSPGQWQNRMILAADDERTLVDTAREPWHTLQVETLSRERVPPAIDKVKVYLTEYPRNDFGKKPDGQDAFIDEFTRGALMVTYTGHGDQNTLAQEEVFVAQKVSELLNETRYSVFSTFSCTVSRFDLLSGDSMTELLLAHPDGGAVTTFSSAGLVFPQQSAALNQEWLGGMFGTPYPINTYARSVHSIGLSALWAKSIIGGTVSDRQNSEKYVLLGDPALEVRFGRHLIEFDATTIDTHVTDGLLRVVRGAVMSQVGQVLDGTDGTPPFHGTAFVHVSGQADTTGYVYDSDTVAQTIPYELEGPTTYRGEVPVQNGRFEARFFLSEAIQTGNNGRISVFALEDGPGRDASGAADTLLLAPTISPGQVQDGEGPRVKISFEGYDRLINGDLIFTSRPVLVVDLEDDSGINPLPFPQFAQLAAEVDGRDQVPLAEDFSYVSGSFTRGRVRRILPLAPGPHTLEVKAFDNVGNRGSDRISFTIVEEGSAFDLVDEDVAVYPNPFVNSTDFLFTLTHDAEVELKVFTINGRRIYEAGPFSGIAGPNQVSWDGRDERGRVLANGTYLYKVEASHTNAEGATESDEFVGHVVKMR